MTITDVMDKFRELYGSEGEIRSFLHRVVVNLIGEHTDYNGGHNGSVRTYARNIRSNPSAQRQGGFIPLTSGNSESLESSLDDLVPNKNNNDWTKLS